MSPTLANAISNFNRNGFKTIRAHDGQNTNGTLSTIITFDFTPKTIILVAGLYIRFSTRYADHGNAIIVKADIKGGTITLNIDYLDFASLDKYRSDILDTLLDVSSNNYNSVVDMTLALDAVYDVNKG